MRIALNNVEYTKENVKLLSEITCSFSTGITYVVGKNGAGKSSLLKLLATAIQPDQGEINYTKLVRDDDVGVYRRQLNIEEIRKLIGFLPQHFMGHSEMTIERYVTYSAFHKGIPRNLVKANVEKWLKDTGLFNIKRRKLRKLSGGQRKKVGLIQALINLPRICILDEPFAGLDIEERLYFQRVLQRLSFHSVIIISTHMLEEIQHLNEGELRYLTEGTLAFSGGLTGIDGILQEMQGNGLDDCSSS